MDRSVNRRRCLARWLYSVVALQVVGTTGLASRSAWAEDEYPARPITMLVPFPPGGVADTVARPVAEAMGRVLGQPVVVENKAGAGGAIGMGQAAKARADGYTVLLALSSITILPEADQVLGRTPLYRLDQLKPVARFTADPTVLVVRADSPWRTYAEFLRDAKARPGGLTFGSSGNYGTMHVPMEMWKATTGTYMVHVPYTGAGPAVVGLLSGQVEAIATGPSTVLAQIKSGRLRPLAHWGERRLVTLPDVPSLTELGAPVRFSQWSGLFVPAGTPDPIVAKLRDAARRIANDPKVVQTILTAGSPIEYLDTTEFERFVAADARTMAGVVKRIGKVE